MEKQFTIVITTKDRLEALAVTLEKIGFLLERPDVDCIVCDDGSSDGTSDFLVANYPHIRLIRHERSLGLMASRNALMAAVETPFAITIDDDLHFITSDPIERLSAFFEEHPDAAVAGFRIFWNEQEPASIETRQRSGPMQSYVGCGHAFRMAAWRDIRPYPEWFLFYGEEDYAAYQLFRKGWAIHYVPQILANHRVNVRARRSSRDYALRLRRSLRAGWYLYFLFYPASVIPRRLAYSIAMQLKLKVLKGDFRALAALGLAGWDPLLHLPRLLRERDALPMSDFRAFYAQPPAQLYWTEGQ